MRITVEKHRPYGKLIYEPISKFERKKRTLRDFFIEYKCFCKNKRWSASDVGLRCWTCGRIVFPTASPQRIRLADGRDIQVVNAVLRPSVGFIHPTDRIYSYLIYSQKKVPELTNELLQRLYDHLISRLTGKEGIVRSRIFGKNQLFSGRAVIIPNADLSPDEIILPRKFANLWQPILQKMTGVFIEDLTPLADEILRFPLDWRVVLLNRQPTLHIGSIRAFIVKGFTDEPVIHISPYVIKPFNADFDGDTMAVYLPITREGRTIALNMRPSKVYFHPVTWNPYDKLSGIYKESIKASYIPPEKFGEFSSIVKENFPTFKGSLGLLDNDYSKIEEISGRLKRSQVELYDKLKTTNMDFYISLLEPSRRSLVDKVVSVSKPGHLTRRLVLATRSLIVDTDDCGTNSYWEIRKDEAKYYYGAYSPDLNSYITPETKIESETIRIRLPHLCKLEKNRVCRKCAGIEANAVNTYFSKYRGILWATSTTEPLTQMILKRSHDITAKNPFSVVSSYFTQNANLNFDSWVRGIIRIYSSMGLPVSGRFLSGIYRMIHPDGVISSILHLGDFLLRLSSERVKAFILELMDGVHREESFEFWSDNIWYE